ncbi:MAG: alkyl sulfatase dimerization domain-containing protein [Arenicella sp.]|nr:alkyl sulfatase dimerization domain-containing protein [Arenicella sp.]
MISKSQILLITLFYIASIALFTPLNASATQASTGTAASGQADSDQVQADTQSGSVVDGVLDNVLNWFSDEDEQQPTLDLADQRDYERANKGFIAQIEPPVIHDESGKVVFDAGAYDFLKGPAPDDVNTSLWRQSQLVAKHGLFKVTDGIYQVRGYDLANITFVEGDTGWIVIDPLLSKETATAAKQLVDKHLGERPVTGVILTHSHIDHYAGVRGLISENELELGIPLVAPAHFAVEAISENVLAGNAMARRAGYMFGSLIPKAKDGNIGVGLGPGLSLGNHGMLMPNVDIIETGQTLNIDGVKMEFILALGAEAPSEFMIYLPKFKAFCQAEIINHTLHNMLTPRGAKVRNGKVWSEYIDEAIVAFADKTEVSFGSHHWPTWGREDVRHLWTIQRDLYGFIHDQTLRLANQGYTINEIPSELKLPSALANEFANRSYYGELGFNARSQYQLYYGFFDGNPANLNPLPVREESLKYVDYMGGSAAILVRAQQDIDEGELQFAATVLNHLVFAEPNNASAKNLLANAYRKLAALTESGPHRNFFLTGAKELQFGISNVTGLEAGSEDTLKALPVDLFFDLLAVRFNAEKAGNKQWVFNFNVSSGSSEQKAMIFVSNGVLHNRMDVNSDDANATLSITRQGLDKLLLKQGGILRLVVTGDASISGNPLALREFFSLVEEPDPEFNIVTP